MNPLVLEKYRIKKGLSITELSQKMDKTAGWYSRIRNGQQVLPSKYIAPLADLFGVKPERLAKEYFSEDKLE
jgi:transcriptional regulator with XRE-family HTH domain